MLPLRMYLPSGEKATLNISLVWPAKLSSAGLAHRAGAGVMAPLAASTAAIVIARLKRSQGRVFRLSGIRVKRLGNDKGAREPAGSLFDDSSAQYTAVTSAEP